MNLTDHAAIVVWSYANIAHISVWATCKTCKTDCLPSINNNKKGFIRQCLYFVLLLWDSTNLKPPSLNFAGPVVELLSQLKKLHNQELKADFNYEVAESFQLAH